MRILFLTHRLPYAPNRGDRIRAYFLMREMSRFARVTLFSLIHDDEEAAHVKEVPFAEQVVSVRVPRFRNRVRGLLSLPSQRPLTHTLLDAPDAHAALERVTKPAPPDLVVAYCSGMARFAIELPLHPTPFVLDMVDVDSAKWQEMASRARPPRRWIYGREARTLSTFEAGAARQARATLVVNERERDALLRLAPDARVTVVPNGVDLDAFAPPGGPAAAPTVVFCGVMNYQPNDEGVQWFVRDVWPGVCRARPDARLLVVGLGPTEPLRRLAERDTSIEVTGAVPAVQPYLWRSALAIAPLRVSRGVQNKVLEALAAGLPAVVTPTVLEGLPDEARGGCRVGADAQQFGEAVIALLARTPEERRAVAAASRLGLLTWADRLRPIERILLDSLALTGARGSDAGTSIAEKSWA